MGNGSHSNFNSHTPRGVQQRAARYFYLIKIFQLTHPSRGATGRASELQKLNVISTHTPLAGCNNIAGKKQYYEGISTHTPLAGCNIRMGRHTWGDSNFNSHTPRGVQRSSPTENNVNERISTHTPLAGCNPEKGISDKEKAAFQLTHPSRGATFSDGFGWGLVVFQLTHPSRGATE